MLKVDWSNLFIATVIFNCLPKSKIFRVEGKFLMNLIEIIVAVKISSNFPVFDGGI